MQGAPRNPSPIPGPTPTRGATTTIPTTTTESILGQTGARPAPVKKRLNSALPTTSRAPIQKPQQRHEEPPHVAQNVNKTTPRDHRTDDVMAPLHEATPTPEPTHQHVLHEPNTTEPRGRRDHNNNNGSRATSRETRDENSHEKQDGGAHTNGERQQNIDAFTFNPTVSTELKDISTRQTPQTESADIHAPTCDIPTTTMADKHATRDKTINKDFAKHLPPENDIDFNAIKQMCESNILSPEHDWSPHVFANHRRSNWPNIVQCEATSAIAKIYQAVKKTGIPNALGCRIPLQTELSYEAWEKYSTDQKEDKQLLDFIKYGFPLGYMGPVSDTRDTPNHPSARNYPKHVDDFIKTEISLGGIVGPFTAPPFMEWCHVSPLMSRDKKDSKSRRIITDMTFPKEYSINSYIFKNTVVGEQRIHALPTIDNLVDHLTQVGKGAFLSSLDVSRAYKNFKADVLDWPLLNIAWRGKYFCDVTMPFGARASSSCMQRVAEKIMSILKDKDVNGFMYLDDIVLISPSREKAERDFQCARDLLAELGLPEAKKKAQTPATSVTWLGIIISAKDMTLTVPPRKLKDILKQVRHIAKKRSISKKQLQSLIGRLVHISKCIKPARLFISRLLEALRAMNKGYININSEMRADLGWFVEFASQWNGVAVIPKPIPSKEIYVDACLSGIGGADSEKAYGAQVAMINDGAENISELETVNVVVAAHTLLSKSDKGNHIKIYCDNSAAVQVLTTGKGRNKPMLDAARALWMIQAVLQIEFTYEHIPGKNNDLADALSRYHLSDDMHSKAIRMTTDKKLTCVEPNMYVFKMLKPHIYCRSGIPIAPVCSKTATKPSQGTWYTGQSPLGRGDLHCFLPQTAGGPSTANAPTDMCLPRVHLTTRQRTSNSEKSPLPSKRLPTESGGQQRAILPLHSKESNRRDVQEQSIRATSQGPHRHISTQEGHTRPPNVTGRDNSESSHPGNVLRWHEAGGSGPKDSQPEARYLPPHKRRRDYNWHQDDIDLKTGQELAKNRAEKGDSVGVSTQPPPMPSNSHSTSHPGRTNKSHVTATSSIPRYKDPSTSNIHQEEMGPDTDKHWRRHNGADTAQSQKSSSHKGSRRGLHRTGSQTVWRMEIPSTQSVHKN